MNGLTVLLIWEKSGSRMSVVEKEILFSKLPVNGGAKIQVQAVKFQPIQPHADHSYSPYRPLGDAASAKEVRLKVKQSRTLQGLPKDRPPSLPPPAPCL